MRRRATVQDKGSPSESGAGRTQLENGPIGHNVEIELAREVYCPQLEGGVDLVDRLGEGNLGVEGLARCLETRSDRQSVLKVCQHLLEVRCRPVGVGIPRNVALPNADVESSSMLPGVKPGAPRKLLLMRASRHDVDMTCSSPKSAREAGSAFGGSSPSPSSSTKDHESGARIVRRTVAGESACAEGFDGDPEGVVTVAKGERANADPATSDEADRVMRLLGSTDLAGVLPLAVDSPGVAAVVGKPPESFDIVAQDAAERGELQRLTELDQRYGKLRGVQRAY